MYIVGSYTLAVIFCFVTMLCWGSWGNTQKLAAKSWRYELFYWDYVIGMVIFSLILAFTAGSIGSQGRPFLQDLAQVSWTSIGWVLLGAVIFNVSNILLSASVSLAGIIMSFFSALVYNGVDLDNFASPAAGKMTPYTAMVIFALGVFLSNFIVNTIVMKKPFVGEPVTYKQYFAGNFKTHLVGILGGCIWALGTSLNYICAGTAGAAVSYALGQGAPMIAAIWGVFIWKEFKGAPKKVYWLLALMFILFVAGLACVVKAGM